MSDKRHYQMPPGVHGPQCEPGHRPANTKRARHSDRGNLTMGTVCIGVGRAGKPNVKL